MMLKAPFDLATVQPEHAKTLDKWHISAADARAIHERTKSIPSEIDRMIAKRDHVAQMLNARGIAFPSFELLSDTPDISRAITATAYGTRGA